MIELSEDLPGIFRVRLFNIRKDSILIIPYISLLNVVWWTDAFLAMTRVAFALIALCLNSRSAVKCKSLGEFESAGA